MSATTMLMIKEVRLRVGFGSTSITFDPSWLLVIPLSLWFIATLYIPITVPSLSIGETWGVALAIVLLVGLSLVCHILAHAVIARRIGGATPADVPLYPFGDAAQVWMVAATPWREALVASAGPIANGLLAGLSSVVWDWQIHPYINASALFLLYFNTGLAIVNIAPGLPFDGGRVTRALVWGLLRRLDWALALSLWLGRVIGAALAVWGIYLLTQRVRFGLETGLSVVIAAAWIFLALWQYAVHPCDSQLLPDPLLSRARVVRGALVGLVILGMLGVVGGLVPTTQGLYEPGPALSVEPMIVLAPRHRHAHTGTFLLTTVALQTPIFVGQWAQSLFDPTIKIVPPEQIVPPDITPQEQAQQNIQWLEESESVATVVALRLAGYKVSQTSEAVEIVSVLPESPAHNVLKPRDRIISLNGKPVTSTTQLTALIRAQDLHTTLKLSIERAGRQLLVTSPLMQPAAAGGPVRLGVHVQDVGFKAVLPFEARIEPQKIGGGPSAGLMFTLTMYNLLMPTDLAGGHRIAGTGTISLDGKVGPIGGVGQKVVGAEQAGAEYFLVPPEDYDDARQAAHKIKVVRVRTVQEAIRFLRNLPPVGRS